VAEPIPASEAPAAPVPTATPTVAAGSTSPVDLVLKVVAAVGTGIGILGFVTFFGGAILWVRLNEAELPATEAVAVIPNSVLVTTGAVFLAPAVAIAASVIAASFVVYLFCNLGPQRAARKRRNAAKKTRQRAEAAGRDANAEALAAKNARAKLTSREKELAEAEKAGETGRVQSLNEKITKQRPGAERLDAAAERLVSAAVAAKAKADNETEEAELELERSRPQILIEAIVGGLVLFVLPLLSNRVIGHAGLGWEITLAAVLIFGALISVFAYLETERFIWFGVAAFFTVGIYLGLATYVSTERNPKVQPAAALRTGHDPVYGFLVADTGSNLYLGSFDKTGRPPHLVVIPRTQVTELTVGPLLDPDKARRRAISLALAECTQKVEVPATDTTPARKTRACDRDQKQALRDAL